MIKPILFNADMVRATKNGTKTVTRRVVKGLFDPGGKPPSQPYRPGDILYVRETWRIWKAHRYDADAHIEFKAGGEGIVLRFPYGCTDSANRDDYDSFIGKWGVCGGWHPSIHMPREAARIFLRVTDVRVERLQDMPDEDLVRDFGFCWEAIQAVGMNALAKPLWDSTINPTDRAIFGWEANPWVWVIEFERISKEEETKDGS